MWDKLTENGPILIQSIISLLLVGTIIGMSFMRMDVPKELWAISGIAVGHWFGSNGMNRTNEAVRALTVKK